MDEMMPVLIEQLLVKPVVGLVEVDEQGRLTDAFVRLLQAALAEHYPPQVSLTYSRPLGAGVTGIYAAACTGFTRGTGSQLFVG